MSQTYEQLVSGTTTFGQLYGRINNLTEALRSAFSGTAFPTSPTPIEGQFCYRTDEDKLYVYINTAWVEVAVASAGLGLELVNARGSKPTLDQRLDVALNEDGTLKASTTLNPSQWYLPSLTFTYVSATSFTVNGDQTDIYKPTRRLKINLTGSAVYSDVVSATYSAPNTTVVVKDAVLNNTLVSVEHSLFLPMKNNGALSLEMLGAAIKTVTGAYTIGINDNIIIANSASPLTITFPQQSAVSSASVSKEYAIINIGAGAVTLSPYSGDSLPVTTLEQNDTLSAIGNGGTAWRERRVVNAKNAANATNLIRDVIQISTTYTTTLTDDVIACIGSNYTITLLSAATYGAGKVLEFICTASGPVIIDPAGSETINGIGIINLRNGSSLIIISDGTNWKAIKMPFRGALAYNLNSQSILNTTWTEVFFGGNYEYDTSAIVSSNSLIVPTGASKVKLQAQLRWASYATGFREARILKNGSMFNGMGQSVREGQYAYHNFSTPVIYVSAGDAFTVSVYQNGGIALDIISGSPTYTWFSMEIIE